ncbi:hypothetical protein ACQP00_00830 [Dactylosporangium sp. CS-047395]|uniref:hypothetical protein n=1 Tax=Dactylosporangium sp. CS-047395 TaxID=3239936 RepID=UPI003D9322B9
MCPHGCSADGVVYAGADGESAFGSGSSSPLGSGGGSSETRNGELATGGGVFDCPPPNGGCGVESGTPYACPGPGPNDDAGCASGSP